ncbi:hypothetical protein BGW38_005140 [Lunasporangiospora selenospora]|uniref:Uncharacterized protein n=1 Tax=Lunasporangiospora selenospora TaxID=979761 RepID=A0A9P6KB28_9FUNG|nr:hypothetical protein BGW38_005140 [Lunasporangiospora selenospora]
MAQHSYQLFSISNGSLPVSTTSASPSQTITRASEAELELLFNHIPEFIKTPDNTTRAAYQRNAQAILVRVCRSIERENYKSYRIFLEDLLDLNFKAWESNKDLSHAQNPISLVLVKVKTDPPIADVLWILIDYCIQMAKEEEDYRYVSPVTSTLRGIIELNDQHRDIVHDTLKGLAFIPVKDKAEIVSLAAVAHSLKFPWPLRKVDTRSIYECQSKSPVFRKGEQKIDQGDHKFAHDVYEASYDMLWTVSGSESKLGGPPPKQTWFHILFYTILFKCGVRSKVNVKCYDFNRDMLDNPAIIALLEYKWNTIGHAYWLVRFYALFLFYFLVLGATIVQVWGRVSRVSLFSGYIVIIVMALVFLMFKVVYYCRRRRPICTDDIVDILVFVLPIIGSGMQIVNIMKMNEKGNISILSFSVLAIFLHFVRSLKGSRESFPIVYLDCNGADYQHC